MPSASPPPDFAARRLPVDELQVGSVLYRIHRTTQSPKFFGRTKTWRFNSPVGAFGTMYAAPTEEAAFAETLLRGQYPLVAESEILARSICAFTLRQSLRLARLHGSALIRIGATAATAAGDYATSQSWAQALHDHRDRPDGIIYRSSRDNDRLAVALFDRAEHALDDGTSTPLADDAIRLARILDHYQAAYL